jgi:hypothetical protein
LGHPGEARGFTDVLQDHPDAVQALREKGPAYGVAEQSPLAQVLADRQPLRVIDAIITEAETAMRERLRQQAAAREQSQSWDRGTGR